MCFGGGNDEAARARKAEEDRQARIREGTARINEIFDGGTFGTGRVSDASTYDPNQTYYRADGSEWRPDPTATRTVYDEPAQDTPRFGAALGGATTSGPREVALSGREQFERALNGYTEQASPIGGTGENLSGPAQMFAQRAQSRTDPTKLFTGIETREGFDDDFFADRRQSYIDYARPQVDRQFADAREQLIYSLARNGTTNSSAAGEQNADLQTDYDTELQNITDKGRQYESQARTAVEDARSNLITTLNATGDAAGAANAALARATALSDTPAYNPVTGLFADFTNGLSQQAALERAEAASTRDYAKFNTGWFGPKADAVKVR